MNRIFAAGALLLAATGAAGAQESPASGWTFALSPYLWLPALSSSVGTDRGAVNADQSTSDILSNLDMAFMGAAEARNGRWSLILDVIYADIGVSKDTPLGRLYSSAHVQTKLSAFTTYAGYRVLENERGAIDLLAGGRFYSLDVDLKLEPGTLQGRSTSLDDSWADPVFGARGRVDFAEKWYATGLVDFGGFGGGSDESWQAFASVGYQIDPRWSVQGGWRYMAIEKEIDGQDVEIDLNGPIIGATFRF